MDSGWGPGLRDNPKRQCTFDFRIEFKSEARYASGKRGGKYGAQGRCWPIERGKKLNESPNDIFVSLSDMLGSQLPAAKGSMGARGKGNLEIKTRNNPTEMN